MKKDIQKIGRLVASVNELVRMNLMQEFSDVPIVYVTKQILQLKDKAYMLNWCKNILAVWKLSNAEKALHMDDDTMELVVFDKESRDLICSYSKNKGVKYS